MSSPATSRSFQLGRRLLRGLEAHPVLKLVLAVLLDATDPGGCCHLGMRRIGQRAGLCERAARTRVRELERLGLVEIEHRGGGPHDVNSYRVNLAALARLPDGKNGLAVRLRGLTPGIGVPIIAARNPASDDKKPGIPRRETRNRGAEEDSTEERSEERGPARETGPRAPAREVDTVSATPRAHIARAREILRRKPSKLG